MYQLSNLYKVLYTEHGKGASVCMECPDRPECHHGTATCKVHHDGRYVWVTEATAVRVALED